MNKKIKKLLISLLCLGGVFALTGCQSAGHDAKVPTNQCEVKIYTDASTKKKSALVTLGIDNNTIYNVKEITLTYDIYEDGNEEPIYHGVDPIPIFVKHGAAGYLTYTVQAEEQTTASSVKITKAEVTAYYSLWDTYTVPFIIMIVLVCISLLFFAVEIFGKGLTKEDVRDLFHERMASSLFTLALVMLICLIPIMFSGWVITLILLGGFIGTIALTGLMALIRTATAK